MWLCVCFADSRKGMCSRRLTHRIVITNILVVDENPENTMEKRKSRSLTTAVAASFGGLAALLTVLPLSFPYPVIPYLKFDLAELPVVIAFLSFGPLAGGITAIAYWLVLSLVGEFTPIGPAMKFLAVGSMLLGIWVGSKIYRGSTVAPLLLNLILLGGLIRIFITTIANYILLAVLFPDLLEIATGMVRAATGFTADGQLNALFLVLLFTSIFNLLHTIFSIIPSALVVMKVSARGAFHSWANQAWLVKLLYHEMRRS